MPGQSHGQPQTVLQPAIRLLFASCILLGLLGQAQAQSFYCFSITLASSQNQVRDAGAALGVESYCILDLRMNCAELEQFCDCNDCEVARRMLLLVCNLEYQHPASILLLGQCMCAQRAGILASMS